jgi:hypothetical protein
MHQSNCQPSEAAQELLHELAQGATRSLSGHTDVDVASDCLLSYLLQVKADSLFHFATVLVTVAGHCGVEGVLNPLS